MVLYSLTQSSVTLAPRPVCLILTRMNVKRLIYKETERTWLPGTNDLGIAVKG